AARHANLPAATLTRRLQKLEATLGCQLLLRSARSLKPTPEGLLYYEQCRPRLTALTQATATLDDDLNQIKGTLRVLAPLVAELPLKQAVALAVQITGEPRNRLYDAALALKND
ncbi:LysR family transcriptional regulator, partial [Acinetobacter baumannii]